ncbi:MAG: TetR/AcrR family transcriptional regulator [Alphaproteobacteria bacterium]|nr:TetR/AcrR family transcriptional regulator [Alphaproteobacteria bacterium]
MPYKPEHKRRTRARIVASASRLFNRHGFGGVSIDAIMADAGLTRGGFYAHFPTKEALYAEAVTHILGNNPAAEWDDFHVDFSAVGARLARQILEAYLSRRHHELVDLSCPMITLSADVTRGGEEVRGAFRTVLAAMSGAFAAGLDGPTTEARRKSLALVASVVGGMALSRAVGDEALADEIRAAVRAHVLRESGWDAVEYPGDSCVLAAARLRSPGSRPAGLRRPSRPRRRGRP